MLLYSCSKSVYFFNYISIKKLNFGPFTLNHRTKYDIKGNDNKSVGKYNERCVARYLRIDFHHLLTKLSYYVYRQFRRYDEIAFLSLTVPETQFVLKLYCAPAPFTFKLWFIRVVFSHMNT